MFLLDSLFFIIQLNKKTREKLLIWGLGVVNMKNNSGMPVFLWLIGIIVMIAVFSAIGDADRENSKCLYTGCDNERAEDSIYCYRHKSSGKTYSDHHSSFQSSPSPSAQPTESPSYGSTRNNGSSYIWTAVISCTAIRRRFCWLSRWGRTALERWMMIRIRFTWRFMPIAINAIFRTFIIATCVKAFWVFSICVSDRTEHSYHYNNSYQS